MPLLVAHERPVVYSNAALNSDTLNTFHTPMFALNAKHLWNACDPSHPRSTPTEGPRMCRRGCVGAQAHARTRTQHVRACVPYLRTGTPAHVHTSGHTRTRAPAVPPRTTARAPSTTRPSASRRGGAAARAGKEAHTAYNVVTAAVFHAPMFALKASAYWNACDPSHPRSTPIYIHIYIHT
jgi:hypothetical protein